MKYVVEGKTFDDYEKAKAYEEELKNPKKEELNKIQTELDKLNEAYKIQREASNNMAKKIFELEMKKAKLMGDNSKELDGILTLLKII